MWARRRINRLEAMGSIPELVKDLSDIFLDFLSVVCHCNTTLKKKNTFQPRKTHRNWQAGKSIESIKQARFQQKSIAP